MFKSIRIPEFEKLATKTANCLLGFECDQGSSAQSSVLTTTTTTTESNNKSAVGSITPRLQGTSIGTSSGSNIQQNGTNVNSPTGPNAGAADNKKKTSNEIVEALEAMAAKNKQEQMNSMSKGPYFLIFMIALLLMGFSLGEDEKEE